MSRATDSRPLDTATVDDSESPSVAVCELVSQVSETPIRELPALGREVDPDALDAVFPDDGSIGSVSFQFAGLDVVVRSTDTVEVYRERQ